MPGNFAKYFAAEEGVLQGIFFHAEVHADKVAQC
jgi:hypothetical protein